MASLKPREQRFLVELLAEYVAVPDVIEAFEKEFGKRVDRKQVHEYNCERPANRRDRSAELVDLFDRTREEYYEALRGRRIARSEWRLSELEELYLKEKSAGLRRSAKATLEQAAKETGGAYTNKRDVTSNGQTVKAYVGFDPEEV